MLVLVLGGSASGKSDFAEALAETLYREEKNREEKNRKDAQTGKKLYVATMKPWDAECEARIARHRERRSGAGFVTREEYGLLSDLSFAEETDVVLFECLSNYLNNVTDCETEEIADSLLALAGACRHLIIVSNLLQMDGMDYDAFTVRYLETFEKINRRMAEAADCVYEIVCGIPVIWKEK